MENASREWYFTKERLANSPSKKCGIDSNRELSYRQQASNFIQDMGQRLQLNQLCINTAIVYMHRFYVFHSFTEVHRNKLSVSALFLAAKLEEQPRKLEHVIKTAHACLHKDSPQLDVRSEAYLEKMHEVVAYENILLQTLGFVLAIEHPHTYVVKVCQLVKASKDLAQTSYIMATTSLHMTTMCLEYKPTLVACVCIHLACKWSSYRIEPCSEGREWFYYVDKEVTLDKLEELTQEFIAILETSPHRFKRKFGKDTSYSVPKSILDTPSSQSGGSGSNSSDNSVNCKVSKGIKREREPISPGPSTSMDISYPDSRSAGVNCKVGKGMKREREPVSPGPSTSMIFDFPDFDEIPLKVPKIEPLDTPQSPSPPPPAITNQPVQPPEPPPPAHRTISRPTTPLSQPPIPVQRATPPPPPPVSAPPPPLPPPLPQDLPPLPPHPPLQLATPPVPPVANHHHHGANGEGKYHTPPPPPTNHSAPPSGAEPAGIKVKIRKDIISISSGDAGKVRTPKSEPDEKKSRIKIKLPKPPPHPYETPPKSSSSSSRSDSSKSSSKSGAGLPPPQATPSPSLKIVLTKDKSGSGFHSTLYKHEHRDRKRHSDHHYKNSNEHRHKSDGQYAKNSVNYHPYHSTPPPQTKHRGAHQVGKTNSHVLPGQPPLPPPQAPPPPPPPE